MSSVVAGYVAWIVHLLLLVLNKSHREEEHLKLLKDKHTGVSATTTLIFLIWHAVSYVLRCRSIS